MSAAVGWTDRTLCQTPEAAGPSPRQGEIWTSLPDVNSYRQQLCALPDSRQRDLLWAVLPLNQGVRPQMSSLHLKRRWLRPSLVSSRSCLLRKPSPDGVQCGNSQRSPCPGRRSRSYFGPPKGLPTLGGCGRHPPQELSTLWSCTWQRPMVHTIICRVGTPFRSWGNRIVAPISGRRA